MQFRTDLALEISESQGELKGLSHSVKKWNDVQLNRMRIETEEAARAIGRDQGCYLTLEFPSLTDHGDHLERYADILAEELHNMLPQNGTVLVVGLGNRSITPDTVGPKTADKVLATRHIGQELKRSVGMEDLRSTAVLSPGVTGQTGIETGELIAAVCKETEASVVLAIDALAARSLSRLGCTVQMCDTGIAPGSGVGNNRQALNQQTLGIPVIGVGIPTVVDARTLAVDLTGCYDQELLEPHGTQMMITPREIDLLTQRASQLLALTINKALQPNYPPLELISLCE